MRRTVSALAVLALMSGSVALAAPCKDAKGKFVKCPPARVASARCKDAKGKFVKCGTPGALPMK